MRQGMVRGGGVAREGAQADESPVRGFVLRDAVAADLGLCLDVRRAAFSTYLELAGGWDEDAETRLNAERFERHRCRVVLLDGVARGYVMTAVYGDTAAHPRSLYVHQLMVVPEFQSRGVGSACMALLAEEARVLCLPLRLQVLRVNPRALSFYLGLGMRVVEETESRLRLELDEGSVLA